MVKAVPDDLAISLDELLSLTPATEHPRLSPAAAGPDLTLQGQQHRKTQLEIEASVHRRAGRIAETERLLTEILQIDPKDTKALFNLGVLAAETNEIARAERYLRRTLESDPEFIDAYQTFGDMHFKARHVISAIEIYEKGLKHAPNRLPLLRSLMEARLIQRIPHLVAEVAERILKIDADSTEAICYRAWADLKRGADLVVSRQAIARILEVYGDRAVALVLAAELARRSNAETEVQDFRARLVVGMAGDWTYARSAADMFVTLGLFDRAAELVQKFLADNPDSESALKYLAIVLFQEGEFRAGHRIIEQVLAMGYKYPALNMVYGLNAFRLGDVETFFREHHTRWERDGSEKRWDLPVPEWEGGSVQGGKLLIYCEQGVGDHVMYATCFQDLQKYARDVIIETLPRLAPLFQRSFPHCQVVTRHQLPPDWSVETIAAMAPAADLPALTGGDIEHLPGKAGFLIPDAGLMNELREKYRARFPGRKLIGISWRSGNRDSAAVRSLDLPYWKQLLELPGYAFISLQYGDIARDLEELRAQLGDLVHYDPTINPLGNLDPFTAQVAAMDMVISVDNSTVHFAGGVGKACWMMTPLNSDWRWQLDRTDNVWYDSVELFQQDKSSGWDGVIERIVARLATLDEAALETADRRFYYRAAKALTKAQRFGEAEGYWRLLLAAGDHKAEALQGIALSALAAGQAADAVAILHRAIQLAPDDIAIKADFTWALASAGEAERALPMARQLTRDRPDSAETQTACGRILWKMGRQDEATNHFARVLRGDPDDVPSRLALAGLQAAQAEWELSRENYSRVIETQPGNALAHTAMAEIDLRVGDWSAGWPAFGWRFGTWPGTLPPHLSRLDADRQPKRWDGGSLKKARVFLRAERSIVEQVLFAGLLSQVAKESRHILLECDPRLADLLQASFPALSVKAAGSTVDEDLSEQKIEIASSLGDLAARYRGRDSDFPNRSTRWPALDKQKVAALREEYQACFPGRRLIGFSWRHGGSDPAAALADWLPFIDREDIGIVALQPGTVEAELARFGAETGRNLIHDRRVDLSQDLAPLAEQIAACDYVVAVDELTAGLAAALARPLVKVARPVDHWWWGDGGANSLWFPGVRLIRIQDMATTVAELAGLNSGA